LSGFVNPSTNVTQMRKVEMSPTYGRMQSSPQRSRPASSSATGKQTLSVAPPHPNFAADYRAPLWDTSGGFLYLLAEDKIWKVNTHTAKALPLATIPGRQIVEIISPASGGRFWSPDARSMYVNTQDPQTTKAGFYLINLTTGKSSKIVEESKKYGGAFRTDVSDDGHTLIYTAEDAQNESNLWVAQGGLQNRRQLTRINTHFGRYSFGKTQLVEWKSADGKPLQGALLLPPQYTPMKKYPLVIRLYGGSSLSNSLNAFGLEEGGDNMQLFATRGYVVFFPDTPLHIGTPQRDLYKMVIPGVDRVVELGIADPDRLGIMGHSYGGYSTLALITQTSRFKAAMASGSVGNLFTIYGLMEKNGGSGGIGWAEKGQGRMGGTPWNLRSRYIKNSPFFYLDRVVTPLLLVHGGLDRPVLAEEVFVGLRRLGKEVVYARYEGEGHTPANWGYVNRKDYLDRTIKWFDGHLKASRPAPTSPE
jgi:dipeptidyl aminopeptidase/acylaminoacyl peptidase